MPCSMWGLNSWALYQGLHFLLTEPPIPLSFDWSISSILGLLQLEHFENDMPPCAVKQNTYQVPPLSLSLRSSIFAWVDKVVLDLLEKGLLLGHPHFHHRRHPCQLRFPYHLVICWLNYFKHRKPTTLALVKYRVHHGLSPSPAGPFGTPRKECRTISIFQSRRMRWSEVYALSKWRNPPLNYS